MIHALRVDKNHRSLRRYLLRSLIQNGFVSSSDFFKSQPSLIQSGSPMIDANALIFQAIESKSPIMAARLGRAEVRFLSNVRTRLNMSNLEALVHFGLQGEDFIWNNEPWFRSRLRSSRKLANKFLEIYLDAMTEVDVLGSWSEGETIFADYFSNFGVDKLSSLEPFLHRDPWSRALKGKTVLVVHPFSASIQSQYQNSRGKLFADARVLPEMHLITMVPYMEGIRDLRRGMTLIDAFNEMREEMLAIESEVIILGAGPLGFPLAAEAKKAGRCAIHLGGATQRLFGIKGKRWDDAKDPFPNDYWVRPLPEETPLASVDLYDLGAYW